MTEAKHTPGPWGGNKKVLFRGLNFLASAHFETAEGDANARLITAAPDLLDALSNLLQAYSEPDRSLCCDGRDCGCMGSTVYQEAEHYASKAIAKAKGRP